MKFDETITIIGKNHVFRVQPEFTEDDFFVWHFTLLYFAMGVRRPADILLSNFESVFAGKRMFSS